jgi:hypothetical protein
VTMTEAEEIAAARADIARQRADIERQRFEIEESPGEPDVAVDPREERISYLERQAEMAPAATGSSEKIVIPAELASAETVVHALSAAVTDDAVPTPWLHQTMEFRGEHLQVRKPTQSALTALSLLAGIPDLEADFAVSVMGTFFAKHLSTSAARRVLTLMVDPDADFSYQELISAMNDLPE